MTIITQDPKAWAEGFKAGRDGQPAHCPYPAGSREAWSWNGGQVEGCFKEDVARDALRWKRH